MDVTAILMWAAEWYKDEPMPDDAPEFFEQLDQFVAELREDELPFIHELYDWLYGRIYG